MVKAKPALMPVSIAPVVHKENSFSASSQLVVPFTEHRNNFCMHCAVCSALQNKRMGLLFL